MNQRLLPNLLKDDLLFAMYLYLVSKRLRHPAYVYIKLSHAKRHNNIITFYPYMQE